MTYLLSTKRTAQLSRAWNYGTQSLWNKLNRVWLLTQPEFLLFRRYTYYVREILVCLNCLGLTGTVNLLWIISGSQSVLITQMHDYGIESIQYQCNLQRYTMTDRSSFVSCCSRRCRSDDARMLRLTAADSSKSGQARKEEWLVARRTERCRWL